MSLLDKDFCLYHYCGLDILLNIIKSKQLWMSDISRSNDYNELRIFLPDIYYAIEDEYKRNPFDFSYKGQSDIDGIMQLHRDVDDMISHFDNDGYLTSFVTCLTESDDDLSLWRGYANDGRGCALGFSYNELQDYCKDKRSLIKVQQVEYISREEADVILRDKATEFLNVIRQLRESVKALFPDRELPCKYIEAMMPIRLMLDFKRFILESLRYKWNTFAEEKEWRMYFTKELKTHKAFFDELKECSLSMYDYLRVKDEELLCDKVKFYARESYLVPYFPIELNEISTNAIKRIVFGPKNHTYIGDILLLLEKENMGRPSIGYSRISYR